MYSGVLLVDRYVHLAFSFPMLYKELFLAMGWGEYFPFSGTTKA